MCLGYGYRKVVGQPRWGVSSMSLLALRMLTRARFHHQGVHTFIRCARRGPGASLRLNEPFFPLTFSQVTPGKSIAQAVAPLLHRSRCVEFYAPTRFVSSNRALTLGRLNWQTHHLWALLKAQWAAWTDDVALVLPPSLFISFLHKDTIAVAPSNHLHVLTGCPRCAERRFASSDLATLSFAPSSRACLSAPRRT